MISAPNHQRLLNGNKVMIGILFLTGFLMYSCSSTLPVYTPGKTSESTAEPKPKENESKLDTVEWVEVKEDDMPPIRIDDDLVPDMEKKRTYNIAMFLPIEAQSPNAATNVTNERTTTNRFVSFYAGALMALEDLESQGVSLRVDVYDSQRNEDKVKSHINSIGFRNMDAIIGPYASNRNKGGLTAVAEYAKKNEVTVISPWFASTSLTEKNPYYVQLRPNLEDHFRKIISHAKNNFDDSEIMFLTREQEYDQRKKRSDINRINYLQKLHKELSGNLGTRDLRVISVNPDSLITAEAAFDSLFFEPGRKAVIVPYYSSSDEKFIYNSLRRINGEKGPEPIHVYTMPIALESEQIGFNLYRNLNMKICRSKFVDRNVENVQRFERSYFNKYGAVPNDDAYHGYDVVYFVGESLYNYGRNFQYFLEEESQYLQSTFSIQKVALKDVPDSAMLGSDEIDFNYFVNKHLDIIEFQGDHFSRLE